MKESSDNLLILTIWNFEDALIQAYTLPYVRIIKRFRPQGSKLFLVTLEKKKKSEEEENEIRSGLMAEGITWLPYTYRPMSLVALFRWMGVGIRLALVVKRENISTIHCWCTPAGAIGYPIAKLLNRRLILDSYEPHAESMVENGTWKKFSLIYRLLFWLEKKQTQRAVHIIAATEGMIDYAKRKYHIEIKDYFVKPACVDLDWFNPAKWKKDDLRKPLGLENKIVCVYAGKLGGIYLKDELFSFVKSAVNHWGDRFRLLLMSAHPHDEVESLCKAAQVDASVIVQKFVSHQQVPAYLALADFAFMAIKPLPTKRYCTPIKDGEYWAMGLPLIIPRDISDDSDIVQENKIGVVISALDSDSFNSAILQMEILLQDVSLPMIIRGVAERYRNFQIAESIYQQIYSN